MRSSFYFANTQRFTLKLILSCALLGGAALSGHAGQSVTLSWNPSAVTNVAGYKIYYGTNSQSYSQTTVVANTTNATISALVAGATYYFAAATLDVAGNESDLSNQASFAVMPAQATLTAVAPVAGQFSFQLAGNPGQIYLVQASTNLRDWVAVATNTAPFVFVDPNTARFAQRFYRTVPATN